MEYGQANGQPYPYNLVFWIVLGWVVAGALVYAYFRSRAPEKLSAVGRVLAEDEEDMAEGHLASGPTARHVGVIEVDGKQVFTELAELVDPRPRRAGRGGHAA